MVNEDIRIEYDVVYSAKCIVFPLAELPPRLLKKLLHAARGSQFVRTMELENDENDLKLTLRRQTGKLGFAEIVNKVLDRIKKALSRSARATQARLTGMSQSDIETEQVASTTPKPVRTRSPQRDQQFLNRPPISANH